MTTTADTQKKRTFEFLPGDRDLMLRTAQLVYRERIDGTIEPCEYNAIAATVDAIMELLSPTGFPVPERDHAR